MQALADRRRAVLLALAAAVCVAPTLPGALRGDAPVAVAVAAASSEAVAEPTATPGVAPGYTTRVALQRSTYAGRPRTFTLHVPDGLVGPAPLVVALHGINHDGDSMRRYTTLERLARRDGFVIAYAHGARNAWNAGRCCGAARDARHDDIGYLDEVIRETHSRVPVDHDRVGMVGFSNGGMMALRYGCERADTVSAIAVVAASTVSPCMPATGVDVLDLHGLRDAVVPVNGGTNARLRTTFERAEKSLLPFRRAGGAIAVRRVADGGHEWFSGEKHGVDASEAVWAWLRDHPRV